MLPFHTWVFLPLHAARAGYTHTLQHVRDESSGAITSVRHHSPCKSTTDSGGILTHAVPFCGYWGMLVSMVKLVFCFSLPINVSRAV